MRKVLPTILSIFAILGFGLFAPASAAPLEYQVATVVSVACPVTVENNWPGGGCQTGGNIGVFDKKADGKSVAVYWQHPNGRQGLCRITAGAGKQGTCYTNFGGGWTYYKTGTCDQTATVNCTKPAHYSWFQG